MTVNHVSYETGVVQEVFSSDDLPHLLVSVAKWLRQHSENTVEDVVTSFNIENGDWLVAVYWNKDG